MNLITKAHLEGLEELENLWFNEHGKPFVFKRNVISFLTAYTENLLKAVKEAGPRERTVWGIEQQKWSNEGFNSCLSSFHSAIDEGIKEISKN